MKKTIILLLIFLPFFVGAQDGCNFFQNTKIKIEKTQINTRNSDFGPAFVNNELWYSAFTEKEINKLSRGVTKNIFYNLFASSIDFDGNIVGEKQIHLEELSEGFHAGPVSYCKATKELFVTLSNFQNPDIKNRVLQKADIRLKLIIVKEINGEWTFVDELPFNSSAYSVGHPAISKTGDTLFFSSNIPDYGFGKTDLYMTVRKNGEWGSLVNLGEQINTKENDMFPFLFDGNMLVFASNGRAGGKTDLDLYYTCLTETGFSEPQSLPEFNSTADDFGLTIHPLENVGYFTSRKTGGMGDDDIYKVTFEHYPEIAGKVIDDATEMIIPGALVVVTDCDGNKIGTTQSDSKGEFTFISEKSGCLKAKASKDTYRDDEQKIDNNYVILRLKGGYNLDLLVRDKNTLAPITEATVKFSDNVFFETKTDGKVKRSLERNTNYIATSELEGFMNESVTFTTAGKPFGTIYDTINVEKVKVGQKFVLENIFYDFDKWNILPESEIELNKLIKVMNDNPTWKVELGSHTDCRGNDAYNEWLSQKRSDSAVGYIVRNGITKERIVAKGYGETQLINKCDDGVHCSEAEHRKNRRTEFKLLEIGN